jgi:hypothetical protein
MFREVATSTNGTTTEGTCSEGHALYLLRTAVRRGYQVEATRHGGAVITRKVWTGDVTPKTLTVAIEPLTAVGLITPTLLGDLAVISAEQRAYRVDQAEPGFRSRIGRINARLASVPPAAARRLVERGLIVLGEPERSTSNGCLPETRTPVQLSLVARLVLLAHAHRTSTTAPRGYHRPDLSELYASLGRNVGGGKAGLAYDGISAAYCSCRGWSAHVDGREQARRRAHEHRQQVTAAMVTALA